MFILNLANNVFMNIFIFVMIVCFVVLLPLIDRTICKKLKLNLEHGISENPNADRLLKLRQLLLYLILGMYLLINFYLVFFSREEAEVYQVNTNFMYDLKNSFSIDIGIFGLIKEIFVQGFNVGFSHIHIEKPEDITQVLTNTMFYIPMGYLLPYTIEKLRSKKNITVIICFLISFLTENIQLTFKRGLYDLDDMFFNTLGGFIGYLLFLAFAYCVTHPDWRKEQKLLYHWKRRAYRKTLYKYYRSIGSDRITILASSEDEIHSFYIDKLGFRMKGLSFSPDNMQSSLLLNLGTARIEFRCMNEETDIYPQIIHLKSKKIDKIKKRLIENGIDVPDFQEDVFTHRKTLQIKAPDNVTIIFSE